MKKFLLLLTLLVVSTTTNSWASVPWKFTKANYAYTTQTSNGWSFSNTALVSYNSNIVPTLNGNTSKKGTVTSPTLTGGLSSLKIGYVNTFKDTKAGFDIAISQKGSVVKTLTFTDTQAAQNTECSKEWSNLGITGDFTIKITNNSPSNSNKNADRTSIIELAWEGNDNPNLGDIVATCGATTMVDNDEYTFTEGDVLSFSAENAESIVVTSETSGETLASGKSSCSWTATETEYDILNIIAKKSGDSDKKMSFSITVNKKTQPEVKMGDLIIKYNNLSVADNDKVEVTKGTTFSISCENAEKITLTDYSDLSTIAEYATAAASWTPGIMNGQVLVAASREGESDKEILFDLVVSEPVITATTHPGTFRHIRNLDEIYEGGEYLLAAALTEDDNTVSHHLLTTLYKSTPNTESQKKYARVTPFEPTNDAYKLNTDNEVDASVRILSVSLTDDGHYIWRHNNETMTAQKNSNNFLAFYTDNFLTNATSTNYVTKTKIQIEEDGSADIYFPEATKNATDEVGYEKGRHIRLNTGNKQNGFHHLGSYVPESLNNETNKVNYSINYHPVELYGLTLDAPVITNQTETTVTFTGEEGTTIEYLPSKAEAQAIKSRVDLAAGAETWTIGPSHEVTINLPEPGNGYYVRSRYHQVVSPLTGFMIQNDGTLTGIEGIGAEAGADAPAEYYDLQGRRVANPVSGLYIRRTGSKVEKVFVK